MTMNIYKEISIDKNILFVLLNCVILNLGIPDIVKHILDCKFNLRNLNPERNKCWKVKLKINSKPKCEL